MSEPTYGEEIQGKAYGWDATKAKVGGLVAGAIGFVAPGATYLLTVDNDGITTTELVHAALIALVSAAAAGGAVAASVYQASNKLKEIP